MACVVPSGQDETRSGNFLGSLKLVAGAGTRACHVPCRLYLCCISDSGRPRPRTQAIYPPTQQVPELYGGGYLSTYLIRPSPPTHDPLPYGQPVKTQLFRPQSLVCLSRLILLSVPYRSLMPLSLSPFNHQSTRKKQSGFNQLYYCLTSSTKPPLVRDTSSLTPSLPTLTSHRSVTRHNQHCNILNIQLSSLSLLFRGSSLSSPYRTLS